MSAGADTTPGPDADVLVVEDRDSLRTMLRLALESHGYGVLEARDQAEAEAQLARRVPAVVITDLRLPVGDGLGVLRAVKTADPAIPVVVMTAYGGVQDAVAAMKDGALDFLAKPVDPDHLRLVVGRAVAQQRLMRDHERLQQEAAERRGAPAILGAAPTLLKAVQTMQRAAATGATVLVEGESGTGKELFARALHAWSPRAAGPFIAINCAAIPETLLEPELFGYEKGAFTGAAKTTVGKIETAHGGTLMLDEIGDLPHPLQAKLLRFLQERVVERVGGREEIPVDVRVVCATNQDLDAAIRENRFRQDLYYRISEITVRLPPLREREVGRLVLARILLEKAAAQHGRRISGFSQDAQYAIENYPWPGNVRELENKIKGAVILAEGKHVTAADLGLADIDASAPNLNLREVRREAETRAIRRALALADDNVSQAAKLLGITRPTLYDLLQKYAIQSAERAEGAAGG